MWADQAFARRHWPDAVRMDDARLDEVLAAAMTAVVEYAPVLAEGAPVPENYRLAHVYHAREVAAAAARGEGDVIGVGDYVIRARPLTAAVMGLLRPKRSRPGIG